MAKKITKKLGAVIKRVSDSTLRRKIARIRQLHPNPDEQDQATIDGYEERLDFILARAELKNNPAIQTLIKEFEREKEDINDKLMNQREPMDDTERQRLLNRRDMCQKHLSYYEAEEQLTSLESEVDSQIEFLQSHS